VQNIGGIVVKKVLLLLCAVSILALAGCGYIGIPNGAIYSELKGPIDPVRDDGTVTYSKIGEAECTGYLHLVALGDCSLDTAIKNGGIKNVRLVDFKGYSILGIINKYTTVVYGD
jgi:hypothetical protein